jgi:hypothetical protein
VDGGLDGADRLPVVAECHDPVEPALPADRRAAALQAGEPLRQDIDIGRRIGRHVEVDAPVAEHVHHRLGVGARLRLQPQARRGQGRIGGRRPAGRVSVKQDSASSRGSPRRGASAPFVPLADRGYNRRGDVKEERP